MMPARLTSPTVGLMPTTPQMEPGEVIEPSVSVPTATAQRLAATATAEPLLEPDGVRSRTYGLRHCPPRPLQPLIERRPRKLAHSDRFVLPRMTAPAARSRSATKLSRGAMESARAREPALVCIRSCVSMLSLISTGMPWSGPRGPRRAPLGVHLVGDGEGVGVRLQHRVEAGAALVEGLDARQVLLGEAAGRPAAAAHPVLELREGEFLELEAALNGGGVPSGARRGARRCGAAADGAPPPPRRRSRGRRPRRSVGPWRRVCGLGRRAAMPGARNAAPWRRVA